jgi:hypothetical protein
MDRSTFADYGCARAPAEFEDRVPKTTNSHSSSANIRDMPSLSGCSAVAGDDAPKTVTAPRRVLVHQWDFTGHRLKYVQLLTAYAVAHEMKVTLVLGPGTVESREYGTYLADLSNEVEVRALPDSSLRNLIKASRASSADQTFVPDGDALAMRLGLRGAWRGHGELIFLILRDPHRSNGVRPVRSVKTKLKAALINRAARRPGVRVLYLASALTAATATDGNRVSDPITIVSTDASTTALRRAWGLDADRYWFAVVGAITSRKNVLMIAEALARATHPERVGLLVAGLVEPDVRLDLKTITHGERSLGVHMVVVDRLLTDEELDSAISATDCVVVAHSNEGPSGILGKAACLGARVVAAGARNLQQVVRVLGNAGCWVSLEVSELSGAFARAMDSPRPASSMAASTDDFTARFFDDDRPQLRAGS